MRFANLLINGKPTVSLVSQDESAFWPISDLIPGFSGDTIGLIERYSEVVHLLAPQTPGIPLKEHTVLAPIEQPRRNIFCVGKNYHDHAAEFQKSGFDHSAKDGEHAPEAPVVFTKPASTVIGHRAAIPRHRGLTSQLDYEAELGVVIGKGGIGITRADAMKHVFGYTIINDFTARDLQKLHRQWFIGKSLDGFCPMGPYIVTSDEAGGEQLDIRSWVNGELRQNSNTRHFIFDIPTLIETLSAGIALQPGDVIATGTPAGVGIGFTPPRFVDTGDVIRIEIEKLGALENTVGR